QLADRAAAWVRCGQRREKHLDARPQRRLPDRRARGSVAAGDRWLAREPARARCRARGRGRLLAVFAAVAARWPARLKLGAPLGPAQGAARTRRSERGRGPDQAVSARTLTAGPPGETGELVAPRGLPRLLAGVDGRGPMALEQHLAVHGPLPVVDRHRARRPG